MEMVLSHYNSIQTTWQCDAKHNTDQKQNLWESTEIVLCTIYIYETLTLLQLYGIGQATQENAFCYKNRGNHSNESVPDTFHRVNFNFLDT